jgi:type II secretory pathway component GspD/PulD (secretin)
VSGTQNIGGISQPVIGQRRIEHETRLQDGEVNLVGGILEDTETNSLSGYPMLTKIPILKYLFGQEDKQRRENEIVFAITPHIIRAQEVNDDNLRIRSRWGIRIREVTPPRRAGWIKTPAARWDNARIRFLLGHLLHQPNPLSRPKLPCRYLFRQLLAV